MLVLGVVLSDMVGMLLVKCCPTLGAGCECDLACGVLVRACARTGADELPKRSLGTGRRGVWGAGSALRSDLPVHRDRQGAIPLEPALRLLGEKSCLRRESLCEACNAGKGRHSSYPRPGPRGMPMAAQRIRAGGADPHWACICVCVASM